MKKKMANAIQLALMLIVFVMLKLPSVEAYHVTAIDQTAGHISVLSLMSGSITTYVFYVLSAIIVAMCMTSIVVKSEHKEAKIHSTLPIIWFFVLTYCVITATVNASGSEWIIVSSKDFPGMLLLGLALGVVILGFLKRSTLITGLPKEKVEVKQTTEADELGKYKELLDKGAITQDEFDAKKKQLLKL